MLPEIDAVYCKNWAESMILCSFIYLVITSFGKRQKTKNITARERLREVLCMKSREKEIFPKDGVDKIMNFYGYYYSFRERGQKDYFC